MKTRLKLIGIVLTILWAVSLVLVFPKYSSSAEKGEYLDGKAGIKYRYRSDGDDSDQDLYQSLSLDYFKPWKRLGGKEFGVVFTGALQESLDGEPDEGDPFSELADSYDNSFAGYLYLAYAEMSGHGLLHSLRIGRQESIDIEPILFDGGLLSLQFGNKLNLTALGGIPANVFEELDEKDGDTVFGGYIEYKALKNLYLLVGYLNLREDLTIYNGEEESIDEDLYAAQVSYRPTKNLFLLAKTIISEDELSDVSLRANYTKTKWDLAISGYYYNLLVAREAETISTDYFSLILGDYQPYHQGGLTIYKGIGKRFGVEAGAVFRELMDYDDETIYNHTYERYFGSILINKLPFKGTEIVLGADMWSAPGDAWDESYHADLSQQLGKRAEIRGGTNYFKFKIDEFTGEETEEVQVYYAGVDLFAGPLTIKLDYNYEDGDSRDLDVFKAGLEYEF